MMMAANAVMAGCKPEYFPVVTAAMRAVLDPEYNLHGSLATTHSCAPVVMVSGPIRKQLNRFEQVYNQLRELEEAAGKFDPAEAPAADRREVSVTEVPEEWMILDIGPATADRFAAAVRAARTVFWNGPMGVFEMDQFAEGTEAVCRAVADSDCTSIIGGGDSVAAVNKFGLADKMSWISTGGGASMELVEGKALPGVEALLDA